jgi:hypothetical protein
MIEPTWALKMAADFGILGLFVVAMALMFRLVNVWAPKFLATMTEQAAAMTRSAVAVANLATEVRDGQSDQREVLIAVRVLANRIDDQRTCLAGIEENCRRRTCTE